jgi:hypothetical protein
LRQSLAGGIKLGDIMTEFTLCSVQLMPCEIEHRNGIRTVRLSKVRAQTYPVSFRSLDELITECRRLVRDELKMNARCTVRLPRGERTPPGFFRATRAIRTINY